MTTQHLPKQAQPGITARPPERLVLAAFELRGGDPVSYHTAMQRLRAVVSAELKGEPADALVETGELGFAGPPDLRPDGHTLPVGVRVPEAWRLRR